MKGKEEEEVMHLQNHSKKTKAEITEEEKNPFTRENKRKKKKKVFRISTVKFDFFYKRTVTHTIMQYNNN